MSFRAERIIRASALALALVACKERTTTQQATAPAASPPIQTAPPAATQAAVTNIRTTISAAPPVAAHAHLLNVPRSAKALTPSSHFDIDFWGNAVNTHTLLDAAGKGAVPVSEARFLWGNGQLYLNFYAGDLNLEVHEKAHDGALWKDDSVTLAFFGRDGKKRLISASPTGVLADAVCPIDAKNWADARCDRHWESHTRIGVDYDGTLNKLGDFDEEWNIQFAIPLASLDASPSAGTHLEFTLNRCDIAFDGQRACGAWGTDDAPAELVLQ